MRKLVAKTEDGNVLVDVTLPDFEPETDFSKIIERCLTEDIKFLVGGKFLAFDEIRKG